MKTAFLLHHRHFAVLALFGLALAGCTDRQTVTSPDAPEAAFSLDNEPIGGDPVGGDDGTIGASTCTPGAPANVTFEYRWPDFSFANNTITVSQSYRVRVIAMDFSGCQLAASSVQGLTSDRPALLRIEKTATADEFILTALASDPTSHPRLNATVSGKSFYTDFFIYPARLSLSTSSISLPAKSVSDITVSAYDHLSRRMYSSTWTSLPVWTTSNAAIATVTRTSNDRAQVAGVAEGSTTLNVTLFGGTAGAQVNVLPALPVASVKVHNAANSHIGWSIQYQAQHPGEQLYATPYDANGNRLSGRTATFSSDNPDVVSITPQGFATPKARGVTTIRAIIEGVEGSAEVRVDCFSCPGYWVIDPR